MLGCTIPDYSPYHKHWGKYHTTSHAENGKLLSRKTQCQTGCKKNIQTDMASLTLQNHVHKKQQ